MLSWENASDEEVVLLSYEEPGKEEVVQFTKTQPRATVP